MAEEMSMAEIIADYGFFCEIQEKFLTLKEASFYATIGMLMEAYCKAHNIDVIEMSENLKTTIREVIEECGKY